MTLIITPVYAALLAFMFFYLTIHVVKLRRKGRISVGTERGGKEDRLLLRAARAHGNFSEYTPISLLLIAFAEVLGASPYLVHGLALTLLAGRILHAFGLSQEPDNFQARRWGMYLTGAAMLVAGVVCLAIALPTWI